MTPDLKTARVYVIPLGGIDTKEIVDEVQNIKTEINKIKNTVTRKR